MALRRTASTLFTKYLNPRNPSKAIPSLETLSFSTTTTTATATATSTTDHDSDSNDPNVSIQGAPQKFKIENPFQSAGPGNVVEVDDVKDHTLVRIVLPGVGDDGFKVWAEKNAVYFVGQGEVEYEKENCGRKYGGSLEFKPEEHRVDGVKAQIKNGILRLLIPTVDNAENEVK